MLPAHRVRGQEQDKGLEIVEQGKIKASRLNRIRVIEARGLVEAKDAEGEEMARDLAPREEETDDLTDRMTD